MSELVDLVRAHVQRLAESGEDSAGAYSMEFPPLTESQRRGAESRLGFSLPGSMRELYEQVGNGGYGPAYGLLGLLGGMRQEEGHDVVGMYESCLQRGAHDPLCVDPDGERRPGNAQLGR